MLVREPIRVAMVAHARNGLPNECCGLIASDSSGRVCFAYPLTNADPSPVTFTIDPDEHFGAMRHAENQGWEISGVFHSHPDGGATPSVTDVAMAWDPEWIYFVVAADEVGAFRIRSGEVLRLDLEWVSSGPIAGERR